jgi:S1-C subfamily serine protease
VRIEVSQLDGSGQGRSWTLEGPVIRLGSAENAEVSLPLPGVLPLHAVVILENGVAIVRPQGRVLRNGVPTGDTRLAPGDVLELGESVRLSFRFLEDAARAPRAHVALGPARLLHGRAGAALTLVFLAILVGGAYVATRMRPRDDVAERLARERSRQDRLRAAQERAQLDRYASLRDHMDDLAQRMADKGEVDARMGEVQRAVAEVETSVLERVGSEIEASIGRRPELKAAQDAVHRLEARDAAAARIIDTHAKSVCLVQGAYGFARRDEGGKWRFLREAEPEMLKDVQLAGDKVPLTLAGKGPVFTIEYTGTGFLADAKGIVVTNRHIAEPWWKNESAAPLLEEGYTPRFVHLRAYFPGRKEPVAIDLARTVVADDADLAALRCVPTDLPPPLPLAPAGSVVAGQRVLLLGYPSGLDALLARGEEDFALRVSGDVPSEAGALLDALAERNLVRPLPTQGHIGDVLADKILFDAPTAVGGSGGPLLDLDGRVVAVNYGILKAFSGANFGVPVDSAAKLLEKARAK